MEPKEIKELLEELVESHYEENNEIDVDGENKNYDDESNPIQSEKTTRLKMKLMIANL